jgi:AcrR family transcriptional regulator
MSAGRRLGRPPASSGAQTEARIIDAARRCFADLGYSATTNREIADDAGITTGAIYHYFESKQALFEQVFTQVEDLVSERLSAAWRSAGDGFAPRMRAVLEASVALNRDDGSLARFLVTVPTECRRRPELAPLLGLLNRYQERVFGPVVDDGIARGELPADVDRSTLLNVIGVVLVGLADVSANFSSAEQHAANADVVSRLFEGTLIPVPAARLP